MLLHAAGLLAADGALPVNIRIVSDGEEEVGGQSIVEFLQQDELRRSFLKLAGAGVVATSVGALGFGESEAAEIAHVRAFKLKTTTETRNTCPYCSVACGVIIYSKGDPRKGETADIVHIEGDADHPTNRGTLCPKGAALKDFVKSPTRLQYPMLRKPGSDTLDRTSVG